MEIEAERPLVILATRRNMKVTAGEGEMKVPSMFTMSEITANVAVLERNVMHGCSGAERISVTTQLSTVHPQKRKSLSRPKEHHCSQRGEKEGKNELSDRTLAVRKLDEDLLGQMGKSYIAHAWRKQLRRRRRRDQIKKALLTGAAYICKIIFRAISTIVLVYPP